MTEPDMTPAILKSIGQRLFGPRWQRALAHTLDVNERTVQRWAAGSVDVPAGAADAIRRLDIHDEWIVGDGAETRAEFIVHAKWPRFTARLAAADEAADIGGLTYACRSDVTLCEIIWIDKSPTSTDDLAALFAGADAALEMIALDDAERRGG